MKYKAIKQIGDYNIGDIVPTEKAEIWLKMYDIPHVELIEGKEKLIPKEDNLDLNGDGKFDKEDARIAGKVLAETKKRKNRKH